MSISATLARLAASLLQILETRLELVSVEVQEVLERFTSNLLWSLFALFCGLLSVLLVVILVVAVCWDHYRLTSLAILSGCSLATTLALSIWLKRRWQQQAQFFVASLQALRDDRSALQQHANQANQDQR